MEKATAQGLALAAGAAALLGIYASSRNAPSTPRSPPSPSTSSNSSSSTSLASSSSPRRVRKEDLVGPFIGALDQGTSSTRFIIFDSRTQIAASHQLLLPPLYPKETWVEHSCEALLDQSLECIDAAVREFEALGLPKAEIKAIGITNQRETSMMWDKVTGRPLYNAIGIIEDMLKSEEFASGGKDHLRPICGLPLTPYFSATKIRWMLQNVPEVRQAVEQNRCMFGTVDTWLIWNLTGGPRGGVHVTDVTNASRTMLMDLKSLNWDKGTCESDHLPNVKTGLLAGTPITSCLGDQQAALVGHMCYNEAGEAKNTYGTGCFLLLNTHEKIVHSTNGLTTVAYQLGPDAPAHYALEGAVAIAGAAIRWLKSEMQMINDYEDLGSVPDSGGMYFVPAFTGLFAPHWREDARGVAVGLTERITKAHFARAVLEGVAFQTCDILDALNEDSGVQLKTLEVGGGMAVNDLFLQIQADLLGINVSRPQTVETTALGAAIAAGLAVGVFDKEELLAIKHTAEEVFSPRTTPEERAARRKEWRKAVERSFAWIDRDK